MNIASILFGTKKIVPFSTEEARKKGMGFHHKGQEFIHYSTLEQRDSAFQTFSTPQKLFILLVLTGFAVALSTNWHQTIIYLIAVLTFLYFADLLFSLYLIYRSFSQSSEIKITDEELNKPRVLPSYTILCPLYKETHVLPQFIEAMSSLAYPKQKLQVMILLEEDDTDSIKKVRKMTLPAYFEVVIVPHSNPKTKPKACNYGLLHATGEYIVIYDAEDIPDPRQLQKAIIAFEKSGPKTACIQAKLNFYNPHQNVISRVFTAEYSLWFELVLTGLQSINASIPLGGTSNHFKVSVLRELEGWDSFNVTEDCDLGIRLVKKGYKTAIVDSLTLEEANTGVRNWLDQRSRWIKGYMQTYLVHTRRPYDFGDNSRIIAVLTLHLVVGGKILSMFINPFMWMLTICYFLMQTSIGPFIESLFPGPVLYMGLISILLGNFLYLYYYMIGCGKHGHHELVKYAILVPFYWLAMSVAAWLALYRLIVKPHHWSKTKHGFHLKHQQFFPLNGIHPAVSQTGSNNY